MSAQIEYDLGNGLTKIIKPVKISMNYSVDSTNKIKISADEIIKLNGVTISVSDYTVITKPCSIVSNQTVTITDPSTSQQVTISVSGLYEVLSQLFVDWFNESQP